ncbi:monocarboxylate transporter 12-like isoform X2 [Dreissena polymorpha]|uniref:monocarboxylate transporter 12-like isoform X2 n=1 Tax=Dreissena polymorpha TaxID=45954 RepID=UPI002263FBF1|nr:monocarboxylate transporter 12-like isoform X2 [Dreissena polymorpha]
MSSNKRTHSVDQDADQDDDSPKYPARDIDGGWGWMVCVGCFVCHVITDGIFYSFGMIFVELLNTFGESKGDTSVIGSLSTGMCFLSGPIVSILANRFGCRAVTICGAFVASTGLFVSAFAPNIQFLYFSLGILTGFGNGMIYLPSIVSVTVYFRKKRSLATGIGVSGSGIGTFIMSPLTSVLVQHYSWHGALIVQSGLLLHCVACGLLFLPLDQQHTLRIKEYRTKYDEALTSLSKESESGVLENGLNGILENDIDSLQTTTSKNTTKSNGQHQIDSENELSIPLTSGDTSDYDIDKTHEVSSPTPLLSSSISGSNESNRSCAAKIRELFDYEMFKSVKFLLFLVSLFFYGLGYYVPYVYLPDMAMRMGISEFRSSWLLSAVGITNTVGRVVFGYISDRKSVNRLLLYNVSLIICGLFTAVAPLMGAYWSLMVYSAMFGVFSGVTISLTSVILADIVGIDKLSNAFGMCNFVGGVSVFAGPPVAGRLFDISGGYLMCFIYAGISIVLSGAILFIVLYMERREPKKQNTEL